MQAKEVRMSEDMTLDELIEDAESNPEIEEEEQLEEEIEEEEEIQDPLEEEEEESSEEEEEEPELEEEDGEEEPKEEEEEETYTVTIAGSEVEVTKEQLLEYASKGANQTKDNSLEEEKFILEQAGLSAEDLKLIAEVKSGSKEALAKLAEQSKIDVMDVEPEMSEQYKPTMEYTPPTEVDKVASEIIQDTELAQSFQEQTAIIRNYGPEFMEILSTNAGALKDFAGHIKSGIAQEIIPKAIHAMNTSGGTFAQQYAKIGEAMYAQKQAKQERQLSPREEQMRKKASVGTGTKTKKNVADTDVFDLSPDEFEQLLGEQKF